MEKWNEVKQYASENQKSVELETFDFSKIDEAESYYDSISLFLIIYVKAVEEYIHNEITFNALLENNTVFQGKMDYGKQQYLAWYHDTAYMAFIRLLDIKGKDEQDELKGFLAYKAFLIQDAVSDNDSFALEQQLLSIPKELEERLKTCSLRKELIYNAISEEVYKSEFIMSNIERVGLFYFIGNSVALHFL